MQPNNTLSLLHHYAELREARERQHGPLSDAVRDGEAQASARAAMELAGHPVSADVPQPPVIAA